MHVHTACDQTFFYEIVITNSLGYLVNPDDRFVLSASIVEETSNEYTYQWNSLSNNVDITNMYQSSTIVAPTTLKMIAIDPGNSLNHGNSRMQKNCHHSFSPWEGNISWYRVNGAT